MESLLHKELYPGLYKSFFYWVSKTSKDGEGLASLGILLHCLVVIMGKKCVFLSSLNPSSFRLCPLSLPFPPGTARVLLSGAPKPSLLQAEPACPHNTVLQSYQPSGLLEPLWFVIVSPFWGPKQDVVPG